MATALTVVYGARRFKVPVTPSTLLSQVRDEVCASKNGLGLSAAEYGLARQGKALDLTLPIRFAGLVNNAHVDLVRQNTSTQERVRVKVRVPRGTDFVGTFASGATVGDVAAAAGLDGAALTLGGSTRADPASELRSLGAGAGGLMFTAAATRPGGAGGSSSSAGSASSSAGSSAGSGSRSRSSGAEAARGPQAPPASAAARAPDSSSGAAAAPSRDVAVVIEHERRVAPADAPEPPEMGVSQFRSYYSHLKAQAEPAMVSKETRERLRGERRAVEASTIRVRLPDHSFLEGKFERGERGEQVYAFVRSYLRAPDQPFALKSMNPVFTLEPAQHLLDDCHFGSRALLVFEWLHAPRSAQPVLNDAAMALARPVRDDAARAPPPPNAAPAGSAASAPAAGEPEPEPRKRDSLKKAVPKWMRLHKS